MSDIASKRARAEALRAEIAALRVQREAALQQKHKENANAKLERELAVLEQEVERERNLLASTGTVQDAKSAMMAAANPVSQPGGLTGDLLRSGEKSSPKGGGK